MDSNYIVLMQNGIEIANKISDQLQVLVSFLVFFVIVILCYFAYKFFDMFFKI